MERLSFRLLVVLFGGMLLEIQQGQAHRAVESEDVSNLVAGHGGKVLSARNALQHDGIITADSPFSLNELNEAYHSSLAQHLTKPQKDAKPDARAFRRLMSEFRKWKDEHVKVKDVMEHFERSKLLFALGKVSHEKWDYAWKHLPSMLMDFKNLTLVLHSPLSPYKVEDGRKDVPVFAGWQCEGGAFLEPKCLQPDSGGACTAHIRLRDVNTDLDEVWSNLLLHIHFMRQQGTDKIYHVCKDLDTKDPAKTCRGRDKCFLSARKKTRKTCKFGHKVEGKDVPKYKLKLKGFAAGEEAIVTQLRKQWSSWAQDLHQAALNLSSCSEADLKVHVLQGATEAIWLMTSKYAMQDQPDVNLTGSYGGKFKEADMNYAKFLRASKDDKSMFGKLNDMNAGKHHYYEASHHAFVNAELISLESWKVGEVDPVVTEELLEQSQEARKCAVLINVGYAFGSSSVAMGYSLKDTFGDRLRSFHVVGKAGGLTGQVGDYLAPSKFFLWESVFSPEDFPVYETIDTGHEVDLSLWSGGREPAVHKGALMTVPSVILQSHELLNAAKGEPWGTDSIEMESYWFKKALPDTPGLYLYYTSDIPQAADSSLAHESYPWQEGQTLFNGLARMVFVQMLKDMSEGGLPVTPTTATTASTTSRDSETTTSSSSAATAKAGFGLLLAGLLAGSQRH